MLPSKSKGIILQTEIFHIPWVAMSPLHQVMLVPAPTARLSNSTMGHGVIDGNRFGLHPFYEPSVMERKTRTFALARRGTCNPTSSIGTFLINSLSGYLGLWDLRLAHLMESKVLFAQSFGFDACRKIDFLPCMSLSYMDEMLFSGEKKKYIQLSSCWNEKAETAVSQHLRYDVLWNCVWKKTEAQIQACGQ